MIAPHIEDDEDAVVNLPQLVEIVAGNTPQILQEQDDIETTIVLPTTGTEILDNNLETTETPTTKTTVESSTALTSTTKKSFLLPISG